jgi:hypothetical protein
MLEGLQAEDRVRGRGATNTSYRGNSDGVSRLLVKGAVRKG